eukprot:NODE_1089_length_1244_cov_26.216989.p9 GENE.NODE_1089_length_1244_cov_26.216989~~NODE_1089_length_1244_cov_26.216989.p9  ORF type:complete len:60 (-),score=5.38 NODE_1089_length_1244_cov_26.216989:923-1102(-)
MYASAAARAWWNHCLPDHPEECAAGKPQKLAPKQAGADQKNSSQGLKSHHARMLEGLLV